MRQTEESGITLIVLAITVLVMLILSAVAIHAAIGDGGLITRAEDAANRYDRVENEELAYMNGMSHRYDNIMENASKVRPSIQDIKISTKDNSATIVVTATNVEYYRYYYKKANENNYTLLSEQNGNIYTIDGLDIDETYKIKVEAVNGEKKTEREIEVNIGAALSAEGNIRFGNLVWSNQKASISMSTTSGYTIQYQVNGEEESGWVTGTKAENLSLDDIVYVRLWNGTKGGKSTSVTVTEINPPVVNITIGQVGTNTIEASVSAQDNESGMPDSPVYEFYIKKSSDGSFPSNPSYRGTNNNYKFTELDNNTSYDIKVVTHDIAGNEGNSISRNNRTVAISGEGGGISFGTVEWQSDHTARVVISTTTSYTVQYQVNGTSEGNWTTGTIASNLRVNDRLYARLWDGSSSSGSIDTVITDTVIPNAADISIIKTSMGVGETQNITVKQSDGQSGVKIGSCRWVFNKISGSMGTNANLYTGGGFSNETDTIQLTATEIGTYYLHILTVDNAGQARETKAGPITVSKLITNLTLDQETMGLTPGDKQALTAIITPSDATTKAIEWRSDNEEVATVVDGVVTAIGQGMATITATTTDGSGISVSCVVTVDTYIDATIQITESIPTWSSASVFRRSEVPYNPNNEDNLAGQHDTINTTGNYGIETWVDVNGTQWWYSKAKTVQLQSLGYHAFFSMCAKNTIQELYLNEFDLSSVTSFGGQYRTGNATTGYYSGNYGGITWCDPYGSAEYRWTALKRIHLDGCDFSNVTSMKNMFRYSGIETIDFSVAKDGGATSRKVDDMTAMFANSTNLKNVNLGNLNTQAVTTMASMFTECSSLQTVNISSFNTISCTQFYRMFYNCTSLQNVIVSSRFTNNAATDFDEMLYNVPTTFDKGCFGWTNGTWDSRGTFTKN